MQKQIWKSVMDDRFLMQSLPFSGLCLVKRKPVADTRGFLQRLYCKEVLASYGITKSIEQINHTLTHTMGAIRGMHFQHPPHAETKMITCLRGRVFDVAVDIREHSPTFLQWHAEILSPELQNSMIIPEGFAHGFQTLSHDCELLYLHTASWNKLAEDGISPVDPLLDIAWPLDITDISDRDLNHPPLTALFKGITNAV